MHIINFPVAAITIAQNNKVLLYHKRTPLQGGRGAKNRKPQTYPPLGGQGGKVAGCKNEIYV
jgi:hypothetical protein